jgi:hypothetical protein
MNHETSGGMGNGKQSIPSAYPGRQDWFWWAHTVDLRMKEKPLESLQTQRDELVEELHSVYSGAPSTTFQAYRKAQDALQKFEDMTFSDAEIDAFLPQELKRG